MKMKASLESVSTKKNVTDDIVQKVVLNVFVSADEIGKLNTFYQKPLEVTIEESQ